MWPEVETREGAALPRVHPAHHLKIMAENNKNSGSLLNEIMAIPNNILPVLAILFLFIFL